MTDLKAFSLTTLPPPPASQQQPHAPPPAWSAQVKLAAALLTQMVVGQVLYGRLLDVLRRIAEQHHAGVRWG